MRHGAVELIYAPVIRPVEFKSAGVILVVHLRYSPHSIGHGIRIIAEIYRVQFGAEPGHPCKGYIRGHEFGAVGRDRIICLAGGHEEAPDPASMFGHTVGLHFIDAPVISRLGSETVRIEISW
ncbi:hypothetical protein ES703_74727 [subsurface metagenome]